jgi:hypothetical protein
MCLLDIPTTTTKWVINDLPTTLSLTQHRFKTGEEELSAYKVNILPILVQQSSNENTYLAVAIALIVGVNISRTSRLVQ